ncbi:MAG TPA: phosphate ABC transporter permease PstA [Myxococcota bacterium]|nr:phosphate ABC transporter permease PstA [Myxococcota bacterium]
MSRLYTVDAQAVAAERAFRAIAILALVLPLCLLALLFGGTLIDGMSRLSFDFLSGFPSRRPEEAGILPALAGTMALMLLTAAMAIPVGVGAAIYLEEYASPGKITTLIEVNIRNLAGVPSIIYGLLGLEVFVRSLQMDRSLIAGACTLALLLLPMVVMASREALRTVPRMYREAAWALGAEKWTGIRRVVLPMCLPGILTGVILSLARAIGETAPLITLGALTYVSFLPSSLKSAFTALPIQIFNWTSRPQAGFHIAAAAGIVVLLTMMLLLNATAIFLRMRLQKKVTW